MKYVIILAALMMSCKEQEPPKTVEFKLPSRMVRIITPTDSVARTYYYDGNLDTMYEVQ